MTFKEAWDSLDEVNQEQMDWFAEESDECQNYRGTIEGQTHKLLTSLAIGIARDRDTEDMLVEVATMLEASFVLGRTLQYRMMAGTITAIRPITTSDDRPV